MRRTVLLLAVLLAAAPAARARGLLIPEDKNLPPLAMLNHKVHAAIDDQVAVTRVEQTFRNHTDRQLEATYVFPVPKGAAVNKFTMWVGDKETAGEMVEAGKAREIYTSIVRRTQDPGLLEYLGNNLMRLRVFPILPRSDQKVAISFTSVAPSDGGLIEYVYPLKTDGRAAATLEDFSITATVKSQHAIQNIYSPTHAVTLRRAGDREVTVQFEKNQALLDKDFQLFYSLGDKDVGLTALTHRPLSAEPGYFLMLISPKVELSASHIVPRDMVFVLDTSGSMLQNGKMDQAKKALKFCLNSLAPTDRFAVLNFATTVNRFRDGLLDAGKEPVAAASVWVDRLQSTGGTAINDALAAALDLRGPDTGRTFTIVFFTDGQPTIGETDWNKILNNVAGKNSTNTRIFTFGVGHDVNATMLDTLAERSRAVATYVKPEEDIEAKVSGLYSKISHPVLANLKLTVGKDVGFLEVYPPQLPDLFHGGQLVVLGRYSGSGPAAVTLTGSVGKDERKYVYETTFPDRTTEAKDFVEHLWARRKVGYLIDQIRANGEKKELVDEVTSLAKKYGITTPYTSWLIVPDGAVPVAGGMQNGRPNVGFGMPGGGPASGPVPGGIGGGGFSGGLGGRGAGGALPPGLAPRAPAEQPRRVEDFAKQNQAKPGDLAGKRDGLADRELAEGAARAKGEAKKVLEDAKEKKDAYDQARRALSTRQTSQVQGQALGVQLSIQMNNLRNQSRLEPTALRQVNGRNCVEFQGVWIDEGFGAQTPTLVVKAMSDAYFDLLKKEPKLKEVFQLGNHLVWVAPSGTALVIDLNDGKEKLTDAEMEKLFTAAKKS